MMSHPICFICPFPIPPHFQDGDMSYMGPFPFYHYSPVVSRRLRDYFWAKVTSWASVLSDLCVNPVCLQHDIKLTLYSLQFSSYFNVLPANLYILQKYVIQNTDIVQSICTKICILKILYIKI